MPTHVPVRAVAVTVDATLWVSRGAAGTLADGTRTVLARIDTVDRVDDVVVRGMSPTTNDIRVSVTADLIIREVPPSVVDTLEAGVGVLAVDVITVDIIDL